MRKPITTGGSKNDLQDLRGAIADYTKTIELAPDDAIAYHNRGLVKITLNQKDGGCFDLSKAGELGLGKAYDMIRKYCN